MSVQALLQDTPLRTRKNDIDRHILLGHSLVVLSESGIDYDVCRTGGGWSNKSETFGHHLDPGMHDSKHNRLPALYIITSMQF